MTRVIGVLMVNVGTPDSPRTSDVRRYLRQFLSDPRVVDAPRWWWLPLLNLVILPLRAPKSAHAYASIWTKEGSPLLVQSARQRELLATELGPDYAVELAMGCGEPSIPAAIEALCARGSEILVLLPMFPQYSDVTTGSVHAAVFAALLRRRFQPALRTVAPWYADEGYIAALVERIREASAGKEPTHHVFSFHGLPKRYVDAGDPYREHCEATASALAGKLGLARDRWTLVYQSRFGREPWLEPYADQAVPALATRHRRVLISLPGFSADCLETVEEIGLRLARSFVAHGGEELIVVPALNDSKTLMRALAARVREIASPSPRR